MELPIEIWSSILQKTKVFSNCERLYASLPENIKKDLKKIYENHIQKITLNILCSKKDGLILYRNGKLKNFNYSDQIIFLRYIKNLCIDNKVIDCIVSVSYNNKIVFWNVNNYKNIAEIQIETNIKSVEFHPIKPIMLVICDEIRIYNFENNGNYTIKISTQNIDDSKKIYFFHPTLFYIYTFILFPFSKNKKIEIIKKIIIYDYEDYYIKIINRIDCGDEKYLTPIKMNDDKLFECIKYYNNNYYFLEFKIINNFLQEINNQKIVNNFDINYNFIINDIIRINNNIYFHTMSYDLHENNNLSSIFNKNVDYEITILYQTNNKLSKIIYKNNCLIFVEDDKFKIIDIETNKVNDLFYLNDKIINDFLII
jgi:hypothetical protein